MTETARSGTVATAEIVDTKLVNHTRRCDGRDICSCILRVESAFFHRNLTGKAAAKKRRVTASALAAVKGTVSRYQKVTNIQHLSFELKILITSFLSPRALGRLGMVRCLPYRAKEL